MKAVFQVKPSLQQYHCTYNPELVLNHIRSLGSNESLSTIQLSSKLQMLMLVSGQQGKNLQLLDTRSMSVSTSRVSFGVGDLMKTSWPGNHLSCIVFRAYSPDIQLCVYITILTYLRRTEDTHGTITRFFLTTRPLLGWLPGILSGVGLGTSWPLQELTFPSLLLIPLGLPLPAKQLCPCLCLPSCTLWDGFRNLLLQNSTRNRCVDRVYLVEQFCHNFFFVCMT